MSQGQQSQPPSQSIPSHVSALLSHLTSRPGVQSTLILNRKDGSIIQSTGLLATAPVSSSKTSTSAAGPADKSNNTTDRPSESIPPTEDADETSPSQSPSTRKPPTPAETLASHIFTFVHTATALSGALDPTSSSSQVDDETSTSTTLGNSSDADTATETTEGEVRLLRMRSKRHEIVIVPDRKFLLCVVHGVGNSGNGV